MQQHTTCPYCGVGCGVTATLEDGVVTGVEGDREHPANYGRLCVKGSALHETLGDHGRLLAPRVDGREVSWDDALAQVANRLVAVRERHGGEAIAGYLSGQLLTEDYYAANKLFKGFLGSPHLDTNSRLCMASAVAGYKRAFGADAVPCNYEDLEEAELVVLVGSNLAWNHPVMFQRLRTAKQRNPLLRVVVIDPRVTDTCEVADLYLPLKPGSDARLFNGLLAFMADKDKLDAVYLERHTQGLDEALAAARNEATTLAAIADDCELDAEALETFYYWFASQLHVVTLYSQGVNQSSSGTDKCNAIINCHLAGGKLGLPGAGPFSITGQPNAMGGREVGGLANQLAAHMDYHTPGAQSLVTEFWHAPHLPDGPGLKAVELFEAIERDEIQALWIMATNPVVSLPDADRAKRALAKCPLVIVSECMADTDTLAYADIVLPASSWAEKDGTVTNSERRISRQRGMLPPPGEARHDWWIITQVARYLGYEEAFAYSHPRDIFVEHARLSGHANRADGVPRVFDISALAGLDRAAYDALAPIQWPVTEAAPDGTARLFEDGCFATPDGRARLVAVTPHAPRQAVSGAHPLRLNSGRVRDQWHTMTRTGRAPRLLNHRAEPYVDLHPDDAEAAGVADGGLARLYNAHGEARVRARVATAQRRGEAFMPIHWNAQFSNAGRVGTLFAAHTDPVSGQPETKHGAVALAPLAIAKEATLLVANDSGALSERASLAYWARMPLEHAERWQLASEADASPRDWPAWCAEQFGVAATLWSEDAASGRLRAAGVRDGRLVWWLMVGPPSELPGLAWLDARFGDIALETEQRRRVLAGCASGEADTGPVVCSCHQVGATAIREAIRGGDTDVDALGARLACGTQCGSCIPELKSLLEEEVAHVGTDEALETA
ncbi:nitrate reductase [Chromohalobacter sp. HP20-39]|uniref:nitrate reductase n=1 Tax=Chromohalobacter sp. HP20-39 TaxID=3079306 RepID=UPI00294ACD67|nr:nitrate reductase [Chromohalobacter sp. HP20-39]MDV6319494.1 nitrate reductase [Chromohalobacter sp. HP20-39]